jgi:hypothetical protein
MVSQLPLILKESAEAARYASILLQEGDSSARRSRRSILDPATTTSASINTFNRLNMFVTNVALDQMRSRLIMKNNLAAQSYLEEFIQNIDSSQHLAKLLGQSSNRKTADAMMARAKAYTADHHIPGSPRHLVERLMYEGLKLSMDRELEQKNNAAESSSSSSTMGGKYPSPMKSRQNFIQRVADSFDTEKVPNKKDVDVQGLAQDLIDTRADVADACLKTLKEVMDCEISTKKLAEYAAMIDEKRLRIITTKGTIAPVDLHGTELKVRSISPAGESPSLYYSLANDTGMSRSDPNANNSSDYAAVNAGKPKSSAGGPDFSLQGILSALFGGGENTGRKGWKEEDGTQPKPESDGAKQKTSVGVRSFAIRNCFC